MESSIAVFLTWQLACEPLPTVIAWPLFWEREVDTRQFSQHSQMPLFYVDQARTKGNMTLCKRTWLVLGGDPAARPHRVEQCTAL